MISESEAKEKVDSGWIKAWMVFEVLAGNEQFAKQSLEGLIEKLDKKASVYKKDFGEIKKVPVPLKNIKEGYSNTCEVELVSKTFEDLVNLVIEFGPSTIEILEPLNVNLKIGEAQSVLNTVSEMMHRFAAAGAGGLLLVKDKV